MLRKTQGEDSGAGQGHHLVGVGHDGRNFGPIKLFYLSSNLVKVINLGRLVNHNHQAGDVQLAGHLNRYACPLVVLLNGLASCCYT